MKKGFTLAEVLITLAIIGVVAALTIPTVVHKYQQQQYYTKFMKAYNTFAAAYQLSSAENGDVSQWCLKGGSPSHEDLENNFKEYIGKYLRISSYCTQNPENCGINEEKYGNIKIRDLSQNTYSDSSIYDNFLHSKSSFSLNDGTLVSLDIHGSGEDVLWDTFEFTVYLNGTKGKFIRGIDVFIIRLDNNTPGGVYNVYPTGLYNKLEWANGRYVRMPSDLDQILDGCSTTEPTAGWSCGSRLLLEGKMDYWN